MGKIRPRLSRYVFLTVSCHFTFFFFFTKFSFPLAKGLCSYVTHGVAVALDSELIASAIYIRNIFYGASLLLATILILDYLSFHPLFGPWAIIIGELLLDVMKFVVVLSLFMFGFALFFTSLNQPTEQEGVNPLLMFELLFFSMFGYAKAEDLIKSSQIEAWTTNLFKLIFASYLLLAVIVLINLLIAMMSDTYQRIQQQSDIEWKYGLAKLIRNMQRTQVVYRVFQEVKYPAIYLVFPNL